MFWLALQNKLPLSKVHKPNINYIALRKAHKFFQQLNIAANATNTYWVWRKKNKVFRLKPVIFCLK